MIHGAVLDTARPRAVRPVVHKIGWHDLTDALAKGFADFSAKPSHMIFLCLIYPVAGILISRVAMQGNLLPLFFPLVAGFALIGPFAAIGFYELSHRRELGQDAAWGDVFELARSPSLGAIFGIGLVLMVIFIAWLAAAQSIYNLTLGPESPASISDFAHDLLTTSSGWTLIIVGNAVGCVFAGLALTVGIVSLPMLVDRNVGLATALTTSARCMAANPVILSIWGVLVAALLLAGTLPLFVGLAVALPVLGHATWHLYRKLVDA